MATKKKAAKSRKPARESDFEDDFRPEKVDRRLEGPAEGETDENLLIDEAGDPDAPIEGEQTLAKLSEAMLKKVEKMNPDEVRHLTDTFYQYQNRRLRSEGQLRAIVKGTDMAPKRGTPKNTDTVLEWLVDNESLLEEQLESALAYYAKRHPVCQWMQQFMGIGPITSAGLVAHLRIEKAPTAGHFWNFAGLNPKQVWAPKTKRPWNARLKTLCFKIGESFVKAQPYVESTSGKHPFYVRHFTERKRFELERNDNGYFVETARQIGSNPKLKPNTELWKWTNGCYPAGTCMALQQAKREVLVLYPDNKKHVAQRAAWLAEWLEKRRLPAGQGQPMLSPAHLHAVARRWVVKLFLSHLHAFWFRREYGKEPPAPYALAILGHAHPIECPL